MFASSVLSLIGNTPLIELHHMGQPPGVRLFAKLEGQNPSGSIKDRIVHYMLQRAKESGQLRPGQPIVEATTGNTGIALAMIGRQLGHPVRVVVPGIAFPAIDEMLRAYGAHVIKHAGNSGMKGAINEARRIAQEEGSFFLDQFENIANCTTHYATTAVELLRDLERVDVLVAGLGTGGTLMGVGRRLKEVNPSVQIVAVEPHPGAQLQGLRSLAEGFVPPILDLRLLDAKMLARAAPAFRATRELLLREGVFCGISSGAVLNAALRWAKRMERGNVVMILADGGWKYLSTHLWSEPPAHDEETLDDILWW